MSIYQYYDESSQLCTVPILRFKTIAATLNRIEQEFSSPMALHLPAFTTDVNNVTGGRWFKISVNGDRLVSVYGALILVRAHAADRKHFELCFMLDRAIAGIADIVNWDEPREGLDLIPFRFSLIAAAQIGIEPQRTRWHKTGMFMMAAAFVAGAALSHLLNMLL